MRETTYDKASAIVHTVDDAEIVIAKAIKDLMGRNHIAEERAHQITQALDRAGFEIRYRPLEVVGGPIEIGIVAGGQTGFSEMPAPEPEPDTWGLYPRTAADLAGSYGCRVEISRLDDPHCPLTDDFCEQQLVVVVERDTGRLVSMTEAWLDERDEPLVPKSWLETVLSAWQASAAPKRAAA
ncbi:hypothetical protein [Methylobacterium sp. J-070]|uniref:hypothetical protein n=1 Tax=Methylobacterium sp. J-070 TaxID=2836650 RepID=UPI001FB9FF2A|nr:hypothetical protein [Methylobacterium sp. J-070]MCJ2048799.1 hypothetical protein [Methylobacterium sp. J-070]